jgi:hypothetical protein
MVTATVPGQQVKVSPTQLLINNEWVNNINDVYDGLRLRRFETINPTTGEVICEVSEADAPTPLTVNSQPLTANVKSHPLLGVDELHYSSTFFGKLGFCLLPQLF